MCMFWCRGQIASDGYDLRRERASASTGDMSRSYQADAQGKLLPARGSARRVRLHIQGVDRPETECVAPSVKLSCLGVHADQ